MPFTGVNWLAVIVATIINMFVGFLWYGPLFGERWLKMIGKSAEEVEDDPTMYVITGVSALVSAYVLAVIIGASGVTGLLGGALIGLFIWVGIGATGTLVYTTFEGPPRNVWLLHALYQTVVFVINGAILAVWG
jgi:hypothetical protein